MESNSNTNTPKANPATKEHSDVKEVSDDGDGVRMSVRREAPAHYELEIQSFPFLLEILKDSGLHRYESSLFEAGGCKWRLILQLEKEKEKETSEDEYLCLYLENMENGQQGEIDALLNFFVSPGHFQMYISIQDGKVRRFTAEKKEWGIGRISSLKELLDILQRMGDNACRFGVEVFLLKSEGKGECFSAQFDHFVWNIPNFSSHLSQQILFSQEFAIGGYNWKLRLYPKGIPKVKQQYLSIYLYLHDTANIPSGTKMHVELKLRIVDQYTACAPDSAQTQKTCNAWLNREKSSWGFPYFIKLEHLKQRKGLLVDDNLIVAAEFTSLNIIKDLPKTP
ncbi:hypothetical protein GQ457_03G026800 [Hibiscus cannabinus]